MKIPFKGLSLILLTGLFFISGCVTTKTIKVSSSQTGTKVTVDGKYVGLTGPAGTTVVLTPDPNQKTPLYQVVLSADGYFDESITVNAEKLKKPINELQLVSLTATTITKSLKINSDLEDVSVSIGTNVVGHTGDTVNLTFKRSGKKAPFESIELIYSKDEYQSEKISVNAADYAEQTGDLPTVKLARLVHHKTLNLVVKAKVPKVGTFDQYVEKPGYGIDMSFNAKGKIKVPQDGKLTLEVPFRRNDKSENWSVHDLTLGLLDEYKTQSKKLTYTNVTDGMTMEIVMEPVMEYSVKHFWPRMDQEVQGPVFKVVEETSKAMRFPSSTYEGSNIVGQSLVQVTAFDYCRGINPLGYLTSFTPTPEGLDVIFSVTKHNDERDIYYSNLYRRSVDGSGETPLTSDKYYHYLNPVFGLDETRNMVFQSNENNIKKTDLYRAKFNEDYYPVGGFARITLDDQFYTTPTFVDTKDIVFYVSYQNSSFSIPSFGSIRLDSGQPTRYANVKGAEPVMSIDGYLYYVKLDENTGKKQVFRSTTDGMSETRVIADMSFRNSNCFSPSISPDGTMMVFVSDKSSTDDGGDNNIFLYNLNTQDVPVQLTRNESDDISPKWIPSRSTAYRKRIFFMSNRGGAYNVWRLDIK